jgi:hypothetical protein
MSVMRSEAAAMAPERACAEYGHNDVGGICGVCGAWLPAAQCRAPHCAWRAGPGEDALQDAVEHHVRTGHPVRVVVS